MKQSEFLEIIELNKGKHRQPIEVLVLGRKNLLFDSEKPVETRLVAKFNVTDISNPTRIVGSTSQFSEIEIDGIIQPSVVTSYTFDTLGEHTVKYIIVDPTSIGINAFYSCTNLISVIIPKSVTNISGGAFYDCTYLTNITIPDSVTSIGDYAFCLCSSLASITSLATTAPTTQINTFLNIITNGTLYVPSDSSGYSAWMSRLGSGWTKVEQ